MSTLRIAIVEAPLWGKEPGVARLLESLLLARYPEINFDFRLFDLHALADHETTSQQTKRLIGHNPHLVFFCCEKVYPDDRERLGEFLEHLPKKSHAITWLVKAPDLLFVKDTPAWEKHLSHGEWLSSHLLSDRMDFLGTSKRFDLVQQTQIDRGGNLHSLHHGDETFTLFGQAVLAELLVEKVVAFFQEKMQRSLEE